MILQILTGLMASTAMVMITKTLVVMFLDWAVAGEKWALYEKPHNGKRAGAPPPPIPFDEINCVRIKTSISDVTHYFPKSISFEDHMKWYKEAEYNNGLNDN